VSVLLLPVMAPLPPAFSTNVAPEAFALQVPCPVVELIVQVVELPPIPLLIVAVFAAPVDVIPQVRVADWLGSTVTDPPFAMVKLSPDWERTAFELVQMFPVRSAPSIFNVPTPFPEMLQVSEPIPLTVAELPAHTVDSVDETRELSTELLVNMKVSLLLDPLRFVIIPFPMIFTVTPESAFQLATSPGFPLSSIDVGAIVWLEMPLFSKFSLLFTLFGYR
jgi:hypothetical protein